MPATNIKSLTGLRAIAAFWVFARHFFLIKEYWPFAVPMKLSVFTGLVFYGWFPVDIFFVLSGFVLFLNYQELEKPEKGAVARYLMLRLGRVWPVHFVTFMLVPVLYLSGVHAGNAAVFENARSFFLTGALNALLLNAWGIFPAASWNEPAWSVSVEWFAYLLLPGIAVCLARMKRQAWAVAALLCCFPALYIALFVVMGLPVHNHFTAPYDGVASLVRVSVCFLAGCLTCKLYLGGFAAKLNWDMQAWVAVALLVLMPTGLVYFHLRHLSSYIVLYPMAPFLIFALARSKGKVSALLGSAVFVYLGEISYAFYMVHYPVLVLTKQLLHPLAAIISAQGSLAAEWGYFAGLVLFTAACASFCYHFVELPARLRVRAWVGKRNPPA